MKAFRSGDYAKGPYAHPVPVEFPDYIKCISNDSTIERMLDMIDCSEIIVVTDNAAANEFFDKFGRYFVEGSIDSEITDDHSRYFIPTMDEEKSGGIYKWNRIIEDGKWYYILNDITEQFAILKKAGMLNLVISDDFLAEHYPKFY